MGWKRLEFLNPVDPNADSGVDCTVSETVTEHSEGFERTVLMSFTKEGQVIPQRHNRWMIESIHFDTELPPTEPKHPLKD